MIYLQLLFLIAYLLINLTLAQVDEYQEEIEVTQNIDELQQEISQNLTIPILDVPCKDELDRINLCELSILSKDEVISFLERNNTAVEIKLKLAKNELNVAKLNFEQQKITLEAKIFDFEEKIKQLQKELSLTNSLLLESRKSQRKAQEERIDCSLIQYFDSFLNKIILPSERTPKIKQEKNSNEHKYLFKDNLSNTPKSDNSQSKPSINQVDNPIIDHSKEEEGKKTLYELLEDVYTDYLEEFYQNYLEACVDFVINKTNYILYFGWRLTQGHENLLNLTSITLEKTLVVVLEIFQQIKGLGFNSESFGTFGIIILLILLLFLFYKLILGLLLLCVSIILSPFILFAYISLKAMALGLSFLPIK